MSKLLMVQTIFKRMNIKLNVEVVREEGKPVMVIGGLTPKWKIYDIKGGCSILEVKWVNGRFKDMKPRNFKNFRTCISVIVLDELNYHYNDVGRLVLSGEIKSKRRLVSSRLKK